MPNSLTQSTRDTSRRNVAPDGSAKFALSRLDADTFASWVPHVAAGREAGKASDRRSPPRRGQPSSTEQNRDDQDEPVQGILVAGADQRRVRRMDVQIDPRDA